MPKDAADLSENGWSLVPQEHSLASWEQHAREDANGAVNGRVLSAEGGLGTLGHVFVLQQLGRQRCSCALSGLWVRQGERGYG